MQNISKWLSAFALVSVTLQTQWLIFVPVINGSPWEFGVTRIFGSALLMMMVAGVFLFKSTNNSKGMVSALLLVLAAWSVGAHGVSVHAFTAWLQSSALVTTPVVMWFGAQHHGRNWILGSLLIGMGITVPFALIQVVIQFSPETTLLGLSMYDPAVAGIAVVETQAGRWLRAYGTLPHPNMYGGFLVMACVITWQFAKGCDKALWMLPMWVGLLVVTFSRSAWITLVVLLVVSFPMLWKHAKKPLIASAVVIAVLVGLLFPQFQSRFGGGGRLEARSLTERVDTYEDGQQVVQDHLWLGTGVGGYTGALLTYFPERNGYALQPVHNTAVLLLAELGIVGIVFMLLIALWKMNSALWKQKSALTVIIVIVLLGMVDHYLWSTQSGIILLGILLGLFVMSQESSTSYHQNIQT